MVSPLSALIHDGLERRGLTVPGLAQEITRIGERVSHQAVYGWMAGGGVSPRYRAALASALGVSLSEVVLASAGLPLGTAPQQETPDPADAA